MPAVWRVRRGLAYCYEALVTPVYRAVALSPSRPLKSSTEIYQSRRVMAVSVGKRYVSPSGAEIIVTKAGPGALSDGEVALVLKDEASGEMKDGSGRSEPVIQLGKRYKSADGEVELLVIKPGICDLRYNGETMELLQPKVLPSAD